MRYTVLFLLAVLFIGVSGVAVSGETQIIKLKDKSVIRGTVLEMKDGFYRINTTVMGEVKISADKVLAIISEEELSTAPVARRPIPRIREDHRVPPAQPAPRSSNAPASDNMKHQQELANTSVQSMSMNEDFMDKVSTLGENPDMLDVLSDPELMESINSMDYQSLMNNEKMQKLMNNPDLRELLGDVQQPEGN